MIMPPAPTALPAGLVPGLPLTALAPMQDVTDRAFMHVVSHYGAPDYFFTEFFRVHAASRLERHILQSIDENTTGRPVFAQLIGEDLAHLTRTVEALRAHPIAGIDLNLGCPAPKVYKKNVGGGLLRHGLKRCVGPVVAGDLAHLEQRIGLQRLADEGFQFQVRQRQQLDRLLQLRRHYKRLRLPQIEARTKRHGSGHSVKLSPR